MKLNLTFIKRTERTSQKTGKPFTSISLKATQYGEKYLSGFGNKDNANWNAGDEVEVAEVKEIVKDGKTYLNFEMPKVEKVDTTKIAADISHILTKLGKLEYKVDALIHNLEHKKQEGDDYPVNDLNPDDINFESNN